MDQPGEQLPERMEAEALDGKFQQEVERLHRLTVYARWLVVVLLWLTLGALSLWGLRYHIFLLLDYFTWAAVKYGLAFNLIPAIGLSICIGMTIGVLVWQSRNILFGIPQRERKRLEQQVCKIRQQGSSHPLWKYICRDLESN